MKLGKKLSIDEMRSIQLSMLDSFADFCKKNKLKYSLGGGTLLGAVRHKGFIPWDDDIDIMMPRPDYDVFVKKYSDKKNNFVCHSFENDDNWLLPFAKIMDENTIVFENLKSGEEVSQEMGVFIDIFPIDACSKNPRSDIRKIHYLNYILIAHNIKKFNNKFKNICSNILKFIFSKNFAKKQINKVLAKNIFGKTKFAGCLTGVYGLKEIYDTEVFVNYCNLEFEGRKMMCIKKYEIFLTQHYGDYMELPPVDKRIAHFQTAYRKAGV